jgi:hypothetical protein
MLKEPAGGACAPHREVCAARASRGLQREGGILQRMHIMRRSCVRICVWDLCRLYKNGKTHEQTPSSERTLQRVTDRSHRRNANNKGKRDFSLYGRSSYESPSPPWGVVGRWTIYVIFAWYTHTHVRIHIHSQIESFFSLSFSSRDRRYFRIKWRVCGGNTFNVTHRGTTPATFKGRGDTNLKALNFSNWCKTNRNFSIFEKWF